MLTLNMIVKNEAEMLGACLRSVADFVSAMVIVDTGSTDETVAIAKGFGAQVECFAWNNDFSAARNYALSLVRTPWALWLDADDLVLNPEILPEITQTAHRHRLNGLWCHYLQDAACVQRRLSLMKPRAFRWEGVVHESPVGRRPGTETGFCPLQIKHRKPPERCLPDATKYLDILLEKDPENWLGLAESYKLLAAHPQQEQTLSDQYRLAAYDAYYKALNHPHINEGTRYLCLFHLARLSLEMACLTQNPDAAEAVIKWASLGVALAPNRAECRVILGQTYQAVGRFEEAAGCYREALALGLPQDEMGCVFPAYYDALPAALLGQVAR
jgi:glycosyltransferase involved in cell wall biosynthesis